MNCLTFYSRSSNTDPRFPHRVRLSNFYMSPIVVRGIPFKSGEHAFHGMKFKLIAQTTRDTDRSQALERYAQTFVGLDSPLNTSLDAKRAGGKRGFVLTIDEQYTWTTELRHELQRDICLAKLGSDPILRTELARSTALYLLHIPSRGKPDFHSGRLLPAYGSAPQVEQYMIEGGNALGDMWMHIRDTM